MKLNEFTDEFQNIYAKYKSSKNKDQNTIENLIKEKHRNNLEKIKEWKAIPQLGEQKRNRNSQTKLEM